MKPLKSARVPCWTLCTVSCSTDPRFWVGSKITVAVRPNDSLLPSSVSCTPSGTFTVEDGDGDGDAGAELLAVDPEVEPPASELQPARATAAVAASATRTRTGRWFGAGTRSLCMPRAAPDATTRVSSRATVRRSTTGPGR